MIELDVRGLACPLPVVKTKEAMDKNPGQPITIFADTAVALENISRLAQAKKYSLRVESTEGQKDRLLLIPSSYQIVKG
jgi:tRNA 2-thiouridine synthesizing protein A